MDISLQIRMQKKKNPKQEYRVTISYDANGNFVESVVCETYFVRCGCERQLAVMCGKLCVGKTDEWDDMPSEFTRPSLRRLTCSFFCVLPTSEPNRSVVAFECVTGG